MKLLNDFCTIAGGDTDKIWLRLNPDHPIYHAHFPGNPITPGVCIVQIVGEQDCEPEVRVGDFARRDPDGGGLLRLGRGGWQRV